jgi:CRP-like cAMP-binding protein
MVLMGHVTLKIDMSEEFDIILATIKSGYCFGVSSLVYGAKASSTAICQEPCELITLPVDKLTHLFQEDPALGYQFMYRLAIVFQKIMDNRSQMIMKTLDLHPELSNTLENVEYLSPIV